MWVLLAVAVSGGLGVAAYFWNKSPPTPFSPWEDIPTPRPLVTDPQARDKVLKQSFKAERVPEGLDAVVVGSGAGGLSVAAIMAKAGKKVLVLEQHDQAGGCCHTFVEKGFEFDVGIHYIGNCNSNTEFKALLDQVTDGQLQWAPLDDAFDQVTLGRAEDKRVYPIKSSNEETKAMLLKHFPEEEKAIDEFYSIIKEVRRQGLFMTLPKVLPLWLAKIAVKTGIIHLFTTFFRRSEESLTSLVNRLTKNEELRAVLSYCFGDYGVLPDNAPSTMHAMLWSHFTKGASYPYGGASEIAFHMIPVIEKAGGRVLVRAPVSRIILNSAGKAQGVTVTRGGTQMDIFAPMVISAAGVTNTFKYMLPKQIAEKSRYWKYMDGRLAGLAGIQLFIGLNGSGKDLKLEPKNHWIFAEKKQQKAIVDYMNLSREEILDHPLPVLFIGFPSTKDPSWDKRYPGKSVCTVVSFTNYKWFEPWEGERIKHRGDDYEAMKKELAHKIWEQVLSYFPQLEGKDEYVELGSPLANNFYLGSKKGEIYGLDHNTSRFSPEASMDLRPRTDIPNLYLSGQDVLSCGFSGAMYGGLLCASEILGRNLFLDIFSLKKDKDKLEKKL